MYEDLKGKTAVITGGSKGIGHAIAERFGKEGMNVVINYNSDLEGAERAVKTVKEQGGQAVAVYADVSTEAGVSSLLEAALNNFGDLDIWINNAGMEIKSPTHKLSLEDWNKVTAIDQTGVFLGSKTALAFFKEKGKKAISSTCLLSTSRFRGQRLLAMRPLKAA